MSVVKRKRSSARPLTRPGRWTSVISPCTKVPGGRIISLLTVTGKEVLRWTPSPGFAALVEMGWIRLSRTLVPAGTITVSGAATRDGSAACDGAAVDGRGESVGEEDCGEAAAVNAASRRIEEGVRIMPPIKDRANTWRGASRTLQAARASLLQFAWGLRR